MSVSGSLASTPANARVVDFRPYELPYDEHFRGPNFVAVHESRGDLLAALGGTRRS